MIKGREEQEAKRIIMKKILLLLTICLAFVSCKKEENKTPEIPTPKYVATWYGVKLCDGVLNAPILQYDKDYIYHGPYVFECTDPISKKEGTFTFGDELVFSLKYKYKDNGEYLSLTDEFDRPVDLKVKIEEVNDSICKMRLNSINEDIRVICSKREEDRRKWVEEWYGKDADEEKISKRLN